MASGYGVEVSLTNKMVSSRLVRGATVVLEAWYRRLTTPRGTLRYALDYGLDVAGYVGAVGYDVGVATLGGMAAAELSKDDRAYNVQCETTITDEDDGTTSILLDITGTLVETDEDLALTLAINDVTVEILTAT